MPDINKPSTQTELEEWVRGLERLGRPVLVRAAIAAAELVLPRFESRMPAQTEVRAAIEAARAWLDCPCERHAKDAEARADVAFDATGYLAYDDVVAGSAANAAGWAANAVYDTPSNACFAARAACHSLSESAADMREAVDRVYRAIANSV